MSPVIPRGTIGSNRLSLVFASPRGTIGKKELSASFRPLVSVRRIIRYNYVTYQKNFGLFPATEIFRINYILFVFIIMIMREFYHIVFLRNILRKLLGEPFEPFGTLIQTWKRGVM